MGHHREGVWAAGLSAARWAAARPCAGVHLAGAVRLAGDAGRSSAEAREEYGFTAFKIDPFKDFVTITKSELCYLERCMTALYDALGPDADIAVDGHWRFLAPAAIKIAKVLEPFDPVFLE